MQDYLQSKTGKVLLSYNELFLFADDYSSLVSKYCIASFYQELSRVYVISLLVEIIR